MWRHHLLIEKPQCPKTKYTKFSFSCFSLKSSKISKHYLDKVVPHTYSSHVKHLPRNIILILLLIYINIFKDEFTTQRHHHHILVFLCVLLHYTTSKLAVELHLTDPMAHKKSYKFTKKCNSSLKVWYHPSSVNGCWWALRQQKLCDTATLRRLLLTQDKTETQKTSVVFTLLLLLLLLLTVEIISFELMWCRRHLGRTWVVQEVVTISVSWNDELEKFFVDEIHRGHRQKIIWQLFSIDSLWKSWVRWDQRWKMSRR